MIFIAEKLLHIVKNKIKKSWQLIKKQKSYRTLTKVLDRNSFRANHNYSDSLQYLYPSECESFRTNPKNVLYLVWWKTVKNRSDLIRFNPSNNPNESEPIRINPRWDLSKPNFQPELIWTIPTLDSFVLIRIENLVSDWFGFIRIVASD